MEKITILLFLLLLTLSACVPLEVVSSIENTQAVDPLNTDIQEQMETDATVKDSPTNTPESDSEFLENSEDIELFLVSPIHDTSTYLMNRTGMAVYEWQSDYYPGNAVYLLENGNLLRTGMIQSDVFNAGGTGGIVEEISPDNSVVWSFTYADQDGHLHHDIEVLPNGNILMIAWEYKSKNECIKAGRDLSLVTDEGLWPDEIIEVDPETNEIVWEWHVWDHLIQEYNPDEENYGSIHDHPELINVNYVTGKKSNPDWNHGNSIDYNENLDQILISVHGFSEIWIIDHSTTIEEASGHSGGIYNHGGDLLYRWGNPQTYDGGSANDQYFFGQHSAKWIPDEYPGGENIIVFNNGQRRPDGEYSNIVEISPLIDHEGNYELPASTQIIWEYLADPPGSFYADHISGVERLPNGNTLICNGIEGIFLEVNDAGETVWQYTYGGEVFTVQGFSQDYPGIAPLQLAPMDYLVANNNGNWPTNSTTNNSSTGTPVNNLLAVAVEACENKQTGDQCEFVRPAGGIVEGICRLLQDQISCVPERKP